MCSVWETIIGASWKTKIITFNKCQVLFWTGKE